MGSMGLGIALHGIRKFVLPWLWLGRHVHPQGRTHLDRLSTQKSCVYTTQGKGIHMTLLVPHHFPQKFQRAFLPKDCN